MPVVPGTRVQLRFVTFSSHYPPLYEAAGQGTLNLASVNAGNSNGLCVGLGGVNGGFYLELTQQANQKRVNLSPQLKCQPGNYDDYQDRHLKLIAKAGPGGTASETYTNTDPCAFSYVNAKQVSQKPKWYEGVAFVDVFDPALRPHGNAKNVAMLYVAPPYDVNHTTTVDFLQAIEATAANIIETVAGYNALAAQQKVPVIEALRNTLFSSNEYNKRWSVLASDIAGAILAGFTAGLAKYPNCGLVELQFPVGTAKDPLFASLQTALTGPAAAGGLPVINLDDFDSDDDDNDDDADAVEMKAADDNDLPVAKVKVTATDLDTAMTSILTATSALDQIIQNNQPLPANSPYQPVPAARQYEAASSAMDSPNPEMVTLMAADLRSPQVNGTPAGQAGLDCLTEAENVRNAADQVVAAGGDLKEIATARAALKTAARRAVTALGDAETAANDHKGTATEEANKAAAKAAKKITDGVRKTAKATERYSRLVKRQELARKARIRNIAIIATVVTTVVTGVSLVWAFIGGLGRTVVKVGGARFNPDDIALDGDDTKATVVDLLSGPNDGITLISDAFLLDASDKQVSAWPGAAGNWSVIGTPVSVGVTYTPTTAAAQAVARYVLESSNSTPTLYTDARSITITFTPEIVVVAQDRISPVTVPVFVGSQFVGTPTDPEGAWTVSADGKSFVFTPKASTSLSGVTKRVLYRIGGNAKMAQVVVLLPAAPFPANASRVNPQPVTVFDIANESGVEITLLDAQGQPAKSVAQTELTWSLLGANQVAFNIITLPTTQTSVAVSYALTYGGKTSLASKVTLTFTASGTVPAAANADRFTADRANSVTFTLEAAALLQGTLTDAGGTWSASGTQAIYTPSTLPATQFSTSVKYVYTVGATPATLSITFLPAPQAISRTGVIRTVITPVDAQVPNGVTAGTVKLWDGTGALGAVTSLPDSPSGGEWGLSVDGKSITFTPTLGLPLRVASVSTAYVLAGTDKTVSAVPGTITLAFSSAPVAYDVPSPKSALRVASIKIPFLNFCVIPDGYATIKAKNRTFGTQADAQMGLGYWNTAIDNGTPVITVYGGDAVGNVVTLQYSVVDMKGIESNTATITVDYTAMQRFMPMAGDCSISAVPVPGQSVAAQVLAGSSSFYAQDPASVKLLGFTNIGQGNPIPYGLVGKDGKSLHAPGQGNWLVDLNGAIVFQADPTLSAPVTPTPVSFQFADQKGNLSNRAVVVIDASTTDVDQLPKQLATLDDTAFWAAYQRHVSRPQPYLPSEDFVAITAILAGATLVCGAGGRNPVAQADFDAGYQAWNDAGQSWDDAPGTTQPSGLVAICANLVKTAMPANQTLPYAARYWRLELMTRMAEQAVPDPS